MPESRTLGNGSESIPAAHDVVAWETWNASFGSLWLWSGYAGRVVDGSAANRDNENLSKVDEAIRC